MDNQMGGGQTKIDRYKAVLKISSNKAMLYQVLELQQKMIGKQKKPSVKKTALKKTNIEEDAAKQYGRNGT